MRSCLNVTRRTRIPVPRIFLALALAAILTATLAPGSTGAPAQFSLCFVCGTRGLADAVANVLLFVPLGAALGLCGLRVNRAALTAALVSVSAELAQWLVVPGRDATIGDVAFDTAGAIVGLVVVRSARSWRRPSPTRAVWLAGAATVATLAVLTLTAHLLGPSLPRSIYYGQWTPELGHLQSYRGRVLRVELDSLPLPAGRLRATDRVRELILTGASLEVVAIAGPPTPGLGSLFSIYDGHHREILLLGPDRTDLVLRYRTRAAAARLDQPDLRLPNAMVDVRPGDTIRVHVRSGGMGYCMEIDGFGRCGLGFSPGAGWAFVLYPESPPGWLRRSLAALWIAGLTFPAFFWAPGRLIRTLLAAALTGALFVISNAFGHVAQPAVPELAGLIAAALIADPLRRRFS